jgi:peptide chain release factor subunit 1
MTKNLNELVRELSEIYDPKSNDSFVSLYYAKGYDDKFINRRIRAIQSVLKGNELQNFNKTMNQIQTILKRHSKENIAIFASHKHSFEKFVTLPMHIKNSLIVDSSPYLRPLARILDEWESFTLLLVSSNFAKIYSIYLGKVEDTKKLSKDIMNKHKKGGWSQARFNRLRKGAIHAFYKEVIDELTQRADKQIIIAGPGTAKNEIIKMLPQELEKRIVDLIDIGIHDENTLLKESVHLISEKEKRQSHESVQHLKQEILKDGLAAYGIQETLKAVKNGQVELLIIEKNYKLRGWICEYCQSVGEGIKKTCPYCGDNISEVDVLEEILEFAERTDAEIEFTDDEEIKNLGHIGAILRFK